MSARPQLAVLPADPDRQAIREYLDGRPRNTRDAYSRDIRCFREHYSGPLSQLTVADLQGWVKAMQRAGLAPNTIRRRKDTVAGLLRAALESGAISSIPPLKQVRIERPPDTVPRKILSRAQVQRLIRCAHDERAEFAIRLLYYTGMRVSELCALRWADVQEEDGKGWATIRGKGDKTRVVGIPARLWEDLVRWRRYVRREHVIGLDRFGVYEWVRLAGQRAGLTNGAGEPLAVSPHWLRHCHITHARQAGCSWEELAEQAGHSSPDITREVYAHLRRARTSADFLEDADESK